MSKLVVFQLRDDNSIYVADLEAGTVERTDAASMDAAGSSFADLVGAGGGRRGEPLVRGIDIAVAAQVRPTAPSHQFFPSR